MEERLPKFINIGRGVYTLAEAEYLTKVPRWSIRRWTRGYSYIYRGERQHMPPVIGTLIEGDDGSTPVLNFADLIEVRFLHAFRAHGVSWKAIRIASERAKELLGRPHPFSTKIFKTDGITILGEISRGTKDKALLDMVENQYTFERVISPYLHAELDFSDLDEPERWWPLGQQRLVVIDPQRSFGAPIIARNGIPTKILARAVQAEGSIELVARWFEIKTEEVNDAVEFETKLAA